MWSDKLTAAWLLTRRHIGRGYHDFFLLKMGSNSVGTLTLFRVVII